MAQKFFKKTALIALAILLVALCVFFACACEGKEDVVVTFTVKDQIKVGSSNEFQVTFVGSEDAVAAYAKEDCLFEIESGEDIAEIKDGVLVISDTAQVGDVFSVRLTVNGVAYVQSFTVAAEKPLEISSVTLTCADSVGAGETIELHARVLPDGINALPVYTVVSGPATIEGNVLTVSDTADGGEIVVKATALGVSSEEKHITVTTIQTQDVFLTLERYRELPGGSLSFVVTKDPALSTYPISLSLEKGADIAEIDTNRSLLIIDENAAMDAEIVLVARSGSKEAKATVTVGYPAVEQISARAGGIVVPLTDKQIEYTLYPESADRSTVQISVVEGEDYLDWSGGENFRVISSAPSGAEITFLLEAGEDVFTTVSYTVGSKVLTSLTISTSDPTGYLRSGASVSFTHTSVPADTDQNVRYRAALGGELVMINGNVVTVKDGADIGAVTIVAESDDGTVSNEVSFTVSGRYSRREYSRWANVTFSSAGENASVWMVLPPVMNADCLTVLVPHEIVDLVIEGRYDGTDETAYKDLYFYFRNTAERTVTLWNFGTIATQGLGGTVMDFGTSGETEIVLKGQNLVRADSPFRLDNSGEEVDGIWNTGYSNSNQAQARRSGKPGYRGTAGGTAISGYSLTFASSANGTLTAVAGSGVNGTAGGNGADVVYDGSLAYFSGSGGNGGNGGDSGSAIYAYNAKFLSGLVTALPGNAGMGGAGGAAGSIAAVSMFDVTKGVGTNGANGQNGTPYPAVNAKTITGNHFTSSKGVVQSASAVYVGGIANFTDRIAHFYGVSLYYGTKLYNPYKNKSKSNRYLMEQQTDETVLLQQANFLMYTMSMIPKNYWREVRYRSGNDVTIYLCKSIKSGTGSVILGLTSDTNNVWFATFETDLRGVMYSGYFNIMLHEFTHVLHYNLTKSIRSSFETELKSYNYGLDYKSSYGSTERVYGVNSQYDETNSCFFTSYSRKNVMEDAAETISIAATFSSAVAPLNGDTTLRKKVNCISLAFQRDYETLSAFATGKVLFGDKRLAA